MRARPDVASPCPLVEPQGITGDLAGASCRRADARWTGWGLARGRGFRLAPCGHPGHDPSLRVPRHQADSSPMTPGSTQRQPVHRPDTRIPIFVLCHPASG
jgi:hypothetical protein